MQRLNIDIETRSSADLPKVGVYKYTEDPDFQITLFAYAVDGREVQLVDLTRQTLPRDLLDALIDPTITKVAFNAQFERIALTRYLREHSRRFQVSGAWLDPAQWQDTMVEAAELGLPTSLKFAADFLKIDQQKDSRGRSLITFFSKPKRGGGFNEPADFPDKWATFCEYNIQDVRTEMAIGDRLWRHPVTDREWAYWAMDQRINDRGVGIDVALADGAIEMMEAQNDANMRRLRDLTQLDNPNSLQQLKGWLADQGHSMPKLNKETIAATLADETVSSPVRDVLGLRVQLSNASTKKYLMMENARCNDGRVHGLLQFYGATRTGRWAGRLLQVQNLPRNYMKQLDSARDLVKAKDAESIKLIFGSVPDTLKQLIRTGLVPRDGHRFIISDFSAIEARVIAWYAREKWTLEAFRTHGKIYEATASQMFGIPMDKIDKNLRQKGKVATLALGYQGGPGALTAMGALKMGIEEDELPELVQKWRKANPHIVKFWYAVEEAAVTAVSENSVQKLGALKFYKQDGWLFIKLPSGRKLAYAKARLAPGKYGDQLVYEGQGDRVAFATLNTYGGKLVENIVQATARDILAESMLRLEQEGYPVVFHIHDEAVAEKPFGEGSVAEMAAIMTKVPTWAKGLPLSAEGFEANYYKKD